MLGLGGKKQAEVAQQYPDNVIAVIAFRYDGVPMYAPGGIKTGLVTAVQKTKGGELELIVHVEGINLPKRVPVTQVVRDLYFNKRAASAAIAALA